MEGDAVSDALKLSGMKGLETNHEVPH
jgi:hypothetical protein